MPKSLCSIGARREIVQHVQDQAHLQERYCCLFHLSPVYCEHQSPKDNELRAALVFLQLAFIGHKSQIRYFYDC